MALESEMFNPQNYYFLFDDIMKFSCRENFDVNEDLSTDDYKQMIKINRKNLREFLQ